MKNNIKRKGISRMWIVILGIIGLLIIVVLGGIIVDYPRRRELKNLTIVDLDFNQLCDGTYVGEYHGTKNHLNDAEVVVTVSAGEVSDIKLQKGALDKEGKPVKLTGGLTVNDLYDRVLVARSLQVDVISGATLTSNAHLKALENALEQAQ